jgi:amino acid transporter
MSDVDLQQAEAWESRPRVLSNIEVFAQSVGGIGPVLGAVSITPLLVSAAGNGAWLTVLLAMVIALAVGACVSTIARWHVSSGGVYSLVPKGLGGGAGFVTGGTMLLAALVTGGFIVIAVGLAVASLFVNLHIATLSAGSIYLVEVVTIIVLGIVALRRVDVSAKLMLILEGISATAVIVVLIVVLARHSGGVIDSTQFSFKGATLHGVIVGCVFGILDFGGFDSAANLGLEARNPRRAVPLAVMGSVFAVGVFLIVATYVQVLGFKGLHSDLAAQSAPLATLTSHYNVSWLGDAITIGVVVSWFSASTAWLNFGTRLTEALSGDRLLPRGLARTTAKTGAPATAIIVFLAAYFAVVTYVYASGTPSDHAFGYLGTLEGYALIIYYTLMVIAAPAWAWRSSRLSVLTVVSALVAVAGLAGLSYYTVVPFPVGATRNILIGFCAFEVLLIVGAVALAVVCPARLARVGQTEEVASSVIAYTESGR